MNTEYAVVLGCPRSGTTYLSRLLKTIPEFESVIGTLLPVAIPHVVNQPLSPDVTNALAQGFERSLDAFLHSGRYHSRAAALQKWWQAPSGISNLFSALRGTRALPELLIYKEPALAWAPEFVLQALPNARIIHIYRDGRDCANSLVGSYDVLTDERLTNLLGSEMRIGRPYDHRYVPWWVEEGRESEFMAASPYVRAIWMWSFMVRRCHHAFTTPEVVRAGNVMPVKYEDLVCSPKTVGPQILEFLGGRPTRAFERLLDQAHTSSIGKHRHRAPDEIEAAERIAATQLQRYGYSLSSTLQPA